MSAARASHVNADVLPELLGYLNLSSGSPDPQFLANLNALAGEIGAADAGHADLWSAICRQLLARLDDLAGHSPAFAEVEQARGVLLLALNEFRPRYREFHRDLLFHQRDSDLWSPLFLGRVFEALLAQGGPWEEMDRIIAGAIDQLNDYVGHRPVAVLHGDHRMEPYPHEWIRPVPLFVQGAGVAPGLYQAIVERALAILRATDPAVLSEAMFDPALLNELAFDPRAYDFDHPANKRPNYHFGQWDPHHIDSRGYYRRFVVQQVTLDVLLARVQQPGELDPDEVLGEAAAVLAGTILMAAGTSGNGPEAYDSSVTLAGLLPRIAAYRDAFYEQFVRQQSGAHGERLREEAKVGKQPLAGARQQLNQQLARRRAAQLEHVHLAILFARMGYPEAALAEAQIVPVAAARFLSEIECRLTTAHLSIDRGELDDAARLIEEVRQFIKRGIQCGAIVDPWSILGFGGQFSLFPSPDNSVHDHRIDQLMALMRQVFGLEARLWSEAAVRGNAQLEPHLAKQMRESARWWDQFATTSIESVEGFSGSEAFDAGREVAKALSAFRQAGVAAGNIAFWREQVGHFNSPKAYALVIDALWQKPDLVAIMALLVQWLSCANTISLSTGDDSFHNLALRWLREVTAPAGESDASSTAPQAATLVRRFLDLLEANAEDFWQVPALDLPWKAAEREPAEEESEDDGDNLFRAAYEDVVYIDSTADGTDADMLESGGAGATDYEWQREARRVSERLAFLRTVAQLWKQAVEVLGPASVAPLGAETFVRWLENAQANERGLLELLQAVASRRVPAPSSSRDSLLEFERRRAVSEALADKTVTTAIDTADAARALRAAIPLAGGSEEPASVLDRVLHHAARGDAAAVKQLWTELLEDLRTRPLLYVPLSKGGDPIRMFQARSLQQSLRTLLDSLPSLGLIRETCQLIEAARLMESNNPVGVGAISEFDRLFNAGYESIVEALARASHAWQSTEESRDDELIECLEPLTESLLKQWLAHSRTLRLSVLERIGDAKSWQSLVEFVERYGRQVFTQRFMNLGNLRAILHQGVEPWLAKLIEEPSDDYEWQLLEDLDGKIPRAEAVRHLSLVIEAVVENYGEYRDYNSTTTQSDRGDLIYTLLDFIRLRVQYDRIAWHLKPLWAAHAVLVRRGRDGAAETWRRALAERTGELADKFEHRCAELRKKYAMRLPTVSDRLAERFIRPLTIDRVRALIGPAMAEVSPAQEQSPASTQAFELLKHETDELSLEPTGIGFDVPGWLELLEQEAETQRSRLWHRGRADDASARIVQTPLTREEVQQQLTDWELHPIG